MVIAEAELKQRVAKSVRLRAAGSTSLNDVPVHCTTNPNLYRIPKWGGSVHSKISSNTGSHSELPENQSCQLEDSFENWHTELPQHFAPLKRVASPWGRAFSFRFLCRSRLRFWLRFHGLMLHRLESPRGVLQRHQVYILEVPVACINENGGTASARALSIAPGVNGTTSVCWGSVPNQTTGGWAATCWAACCNHHKNGVPVHPDVASFDGGSSTNAAT